MTEEIEPTPMPTPIVIQVTSIELEETVIELQTEESAMLNITIEPYDASYDTLRFESSDPSIARVDYRGYVKALYPGTCTIRVYTREGEAEAICSVIVTATPKEEKHGLFSWLRCG